MMASISDLIGTQPILALFLAIGLGYAVGQINILGFSLGIGAVLFVGLFLGAIAPKAQIAGPIGLIGLIMFLYGIGILYGRQFFEGLSGAGPHLQPAGPRRGRRRAAGGAWPRRGLRRAARPHARHLRGLDDQHGDAAGGARRHRQTSEPSIGYSVAYPFGVIGPILCFYFLTRRVKPVFPPKPARFHMGEITIERLPDGGATLGAVMAMLPEGVQVASVRQEHHNRLPDPDHRAAASATRC